ncbi:MAG: CerR family C-terminal domain-containing protein [Candidatus Hydrogenedentes bacterium]|nr:CerR family C-terminal domain-containing protein [Candidatus Hydrogenedentota bacterium]
MSEAPSGTKLSLIRAAGELFAQRGLEGASIRAIADRAGANIAAINYHFGTKENLYTEVLRYIASNQADRGVPEYLEDARLGSREGIAGIVADIVEGRFATYLSSGNPTWFGQLMLRAMLEPSESLQSVVEQFFKPDLDAYKAIMIRALPRLSDQEAEFMAYSLVGQVAFYVFARTPILVAHGKQEYDASYLRDASRHVTKVMLNALGLPVGGAEVLESVVSEAVEAEAQSDEV